MIKIFRQMTLNSKDKFKGTHDYKYALESAVYKGAYTGAGGVKKISIPEYCDIVADVVSVIVKFKLNKSGDLLQDIKKLNTYIEKKIKYISGVTLDNSNGKWFIAIKGEGNNHPFIVLLDSFDISNDTLVELGEIIILCNKSYKFSSEELDIVMSCIYDILEYTDRGEPDVRGIP